MLDRLMADLIVVLHFAFIAFAIGGGIVVLRWRRVMVLHLPCVGWAVLVELMHWHCPLTRWENYFIARYGAEGYEGGFLDHYLIPVIYPDGLTPAIQVGIGLFVLAVNVAVYAFIVVQAFKPASRDPVGGNLQSEAPVFLNQPGTGSPALEPRWQAPPSDGYVR
jgi:hypothetical protein